MFQHARILAFFARLKPDSDVEVRPPIEAADLVAIIADIVARDESDERSPTERDIGTGAETEREIEARVIELGFDTPDGSKNG